MATMTLHEKLFTGIVTVIYQVRQFANFITSSTYRKHVRALSRPDQHFNEIEFSDNRGQNKWNRVFFHHFFQHNPIKQF